MTDQLALPPAPEDADVDPDADYLDTFAPVPTRARRDGWTPEKQRAFIAHLRQHGSVHKAARVVGMSHQSAWRLRVRPKAEGFAAAWERAMDEARSRALDAALTVLEHGVVTPRFYRGRYAGLVHRYDSRLALAALRDRAPPPRR